ncbi:MAG TPA: PAC2 family protein [Acidimicrobiales bacterium]|nr:PAC2 family protein [Acidimicrobiales bacterium]
MTFASIKTWPHLDHPVLVLGLEGWVDAGFAAATALNALLESVPHELVATFDADTLLDQRSRRPLLRVSNGVHGPLTWPELRLYSAVETGGRSLLVLAGPEPDFHWRAWSSEVIALALRLETEMVVGLGAFPAPVPHTRPVRLAATADNVELAGRVGFLPATIDVPAGAQAVLEVAFGDAGIPSIGVWARVPHYVAATPYPEASAALLDELAKLTDVRIGTEALHQAGRKAKEQIQGLIEASEEHMAMVRQLEQQYDSEVGMSATAGTDWANLPTGDELAAELERFLRGEGGSGRQ